MLLWKRQHGPIELSVQCHTRLNFSNCLFRALADQLSGSSSLHLDLRRDTVEYMRRHRDDFEPFLADQPFERHLELLSADGTFGGNDSIVAFSRMRGVTVVIHQLNEPLWQVGERREDFLF